MIVFVLNKHKQPLMPCSPAKARKLLKEGKAKVIRREPFTIKLLYGSRGYKQETQAGMYVVGNISQEALDKVDY